MPCSPRRPCKNRSIASMMTTTTANPPHNIGVPTECILFSLRYEPIPQGYFACHFEPGQCSQSSRTPCTFRLLRAVRVQTVCANNTFWVGYKKQKRLTSEDDSRCVFYAGTSPSGK